MILDGRALATAILDEVGQRAINVGQPKLAIIVANETPATRSYLAAKARAARLAGCALEIVELPESASAIELRLAIDSSDADAIVVQLPLANDEVAKEVCDAIPLEKDADVLSTLSRMRFEADEEGALMPPVAGALAEILLQNNIDPMGKRAVVLGDGWLVGKPCATWLTHAGASVVHTRDLAELRLADIIVSGMGAPHAITPALIKEGAVIIDAGTSELATSAGRRIAGDADPSCADKCLLFTPCPGGVGPVAVAKLFDNVVTLAERAR